MKKEFKDLQIGDKVLMDSHNVGASIITVTKITKTQIVCENGRFRIGTGNAVGDSWFRASISIKSDEELNELRAKWRKGKLAKNLRNKDFNKLNLKQIESIYKMFDEILEELK